MSAASSASSAGASPYEQRIHRETTRQSPANTFWGLVNAAMNLYGVDRTDISIIEESLLRAQAELLQGQLALVQHRLNKAERRSAPERIVLE